MAASRYCLQRAQLLRSIRPYCGRAPYSPAQQRLSSTQSEPQQAVRNPRWLSEQKTRLGKCVMFGLEGPEIEAAGRIARILGGEWRGLVAGPDGFAVPRETVTTSMTGETTSAADETAWEEKVVWGVQDPMLIGHVNNVNYLRYAESARIWYFKRLGKYLPKAHQREWASLMSPKGIVLILKTISVDYLFPLQYPDRISVYSRLSLPEELGSSLELRTTIISHKHQRAAARISEDTVVYDYRVGKKAEIPAWMEQALRSAEAQEKDSVEYWSKRRADVEMALAKLEAKSVFSGKQEDMGKP